MRVRRRRGAIGRTGAGAGAGKWGRADVCRPASWVGGAGAAARRRRPPHPGPLPGPTASPMRSSHRNSVIGGVGSPRKWATRIFEAAEGSRAVCLAAGGEGRGRIACKRSTGWIKTVMALRGRGCAFYPARLAADGSCAAPGYREAAVATTARTDRPRRAPPPPAATVTRLTDTHLVTSTLLPVAHWAPGPRADRRVNNCGWQLATRLLRLACKRALLTCC